MIGSRRKTISIYKELEQEGIAAEKFANIHAPVGLEIGAVTPEEIAVAIVAEMIAVRRQVVAERAGQSPLLTHLGVLRLRMHRTHSSSPRILNLPLQL